MPLLHNTPSSVIQCKRILCDMSRNSFVYTHLAYLIVIGLISPINVHFLHASNTISRLEPTFNRISSLLTNIPTWPICKILILHRKSDILQTDEKKVARTMTNVCCTLLARMMHTALVEYQPQKRVTFLFNDCAARKGGKERVTFFCCCATTDCVGKGRKKMKKSTKSDSCVLQHDQLLFCFRGVCEAS